MNSQSLQNVKNQLREKYRKRRLSMTTAERLSAHQNIAKHLYELSEYQNNNTILFYVSKSIEVDTYNLISTALKDGKSVGVPRCIAGTRNMIFYYITSLDDLEKGSFGVYEPKTETCVVVTDMSQGLCVVPGMAFDINGYRLGYGKGYYDRFLSIFQGDVVGLCYSNCICQQLPRGLYDRNVDILVTDQFICNTKRTKRRFSTRRKEVEVHE